MDRVVEPDVPVRVFEHTSPSVSLMSTGRSCLTGQLSLVSSPDLGPAPLQSEAGCKRGCGTYVWLAF